MIRRIRGTEDILSVDAEKNLMQVISSILEQHNFSEIYLPLLESTSLFARSLGTSTDVVSKEMYTFATASGESISLRPEATASTIRAFLENKIQETPWNVFTYGPMFRHERPQKGRWRQFNQCSIESIGTASLAKDVLFVAMLYNLFKKNLNLDNFELQINWLGTIEDRTHFKATLLEYLKPYLQDICQTCQVRLEKNTLRIFDCKNEACQKIYTYAPKLLDTLSSESNAAWQEMLMFFEKLSIPYTINRSLVRGLDYYSGIVFEFTSELLGAQSAFCGGGRYELASQLEGPETPSIGAAIGIGRVLLLQEAEEKIIISQQKKLVVILPLSKEQELQALLCFEKLIAAGITCDIVLDKKSIKSLFKKADQLNATYAIIIGEEEVAKKQYVLKNMKTGEQETVDFTMIIQRVQ